MFKKVRERLSLFEKNKRERRARILQAARRLIARHGVEGLTLRDLAEAAEVSVPTVYNLVGGKQALVAALLEQIFERVASRFEASHAGGLVERSLALSRAGWSELLAEPGYFRGLVRSFLISDENAEARHQIDQANVVLGAGIVSAAQADGELVAWADPIAVSTALYSNYMVCMLRWAGGELDDELLPPTITYGLCLILLGISRGDAARKLERIARESQRKGAPR